MTLRLSRRRTKPGHKLKRRHPLPDLLSLTKSLIKLQNWAQQHAPEVTFQPPADPAAIANFAQRSSLDLPQQLKEYLLVLDGESRKSAGMIGNWRLMPVVEIQAAWGLLTKLAEKGAFAERQPQTPPYIRDAWWHWGWIPIVSSDTGDYFCLDTDPPDPARHGQVLLFLQNHPPRPLIASSLRAWFDRIVRDLESGVYAYDEEKGFNGEAFLWSALQGKHLFDHTNGHLVV